LVLEWKSLSQGWVAMETFHVSLLVQGLGGLFLVLVCSTLYLSQRWRYFLYWTVAWFCFSLGLLLDSLAIPLDAPSLWSTSRRPWVQDAGVVCAWWHAAFWVFGMLCFGRGRREPTAVDQAATAPRRLEAPGLSRVRALILLGLTVVAVLTSRTLSLPLRDGLVAALRMGVYGWSAALCARLHRRWGQSGALVLAVFLAGYALEQLYETVTFATMELTHSVPRSFHYLGFADFLLQTLTVAGMIAVLLSEEEGALRHALSRLAESEDRFRLLFENSAVGMALFTAEGRFLQVNPAIVRIFGYSAEELRGRRLGDLAYSRTNSPDTATSSLQALADPPELYEREKQYVHKAGHAVWARMLRVPVRGPAGKVRYFVGVLEDVTQRRQAEEALATSEERYRLHFQDAFDGIYVCAENGEFLDANPSFCQTLGYSQPDLLHLTVADVAEDLKQVRRHFAAVLNEGGDRFESRLRCKDGRRVDVEVSGAVVRLEGRRLIHGIVRDITERKRAERLAAGQKRVLEQIAEDAPLPDVLTALIRVFEEQAPGALCSILLLDDTGRLRFGAAPNLPEAYLREVDGLSVGPRNGSCGTAVHRRKPVVVADIATDPLWEQGRDLALRHGLHACWSRPIVSAHGEVLGTFALYYRSPRVPDARENSVIEVAAHLAGIALERKRAQEALRHSEKQYRDLVETSNDLIWSVDVEGRITFINRDAAQRILGHEPEQMLGRPFTDFMPPGRARMDLETFARTKEGEVHFHYETELLRKDGTPVQVRANAMAVRDEHGQFLGVTGTATDITEHKRLEEQVRQAQKMQAIGRLAGGVAHDFNNLLTVITGYSELLLQETQLADASRDLLREVIRAADRAAALTRQLLAFSRKQILLPVVLDLNKVITNLDKMLRRLISEDIDLRMILAPALRPVKADPTQVEQVILNLAVNARDAMPGGGRLSVETANAELDESFTRERQEVQPGSYVMVRVSDTGQGMDSETKAHLFEPFFTTKELGKGTGLGLATVYGIVKQSGGHIYVESEPGRGASFTIYLPAVGAGAPAGMPAAGGDDLPRGTEVVLLVEDGDEVRRLARQVLESHGYTVLEARHGGEALDLCDRHQGHINLLVTDVIMPQMSGRELVERLAPMQPGLRVLYLSGYTDEDCQRRGLVEGDRAFLPKPFTPKALARKVREVLDQ
jgi:PAS domain S-box-containing protein